MYISGFATYVEFLGTQHVLPESQLRDRQLIIGQQMVFQLDALESSKAIRNEVTNPDFAELFDDIAYSKGGSILKMTEHFMKEQNFKKGVRAYLKKHQYGNAVAEDLWQSLTEFADLPGNLTIRQVMDTWTNQPGYPVVNFNGTTLTQERFFLNASGRISLYVVLTSAH